MPRSIPLPWRYSSASTTRTRKTCKYYASLTLRSTNRPSPRKLDSLLKPYGYVCKLGKILTPEEAENATPGPKSTKKKAPDPATDAAADDDEQGSPTPAPQKRKANTGTAKGTKAKSVKAESSDDD
jgi:hypothetical protein